MRIHRVVALTALSLGCGAAERPPSAPKSTAALVTPRPAPPPPSRPAAPIVAAPPPETREQRLIARMLERVAKVRGLRARKSVPGVTLDRAALIAQVKEHVDREVPHDAIVHEGIVQQLLGFVPTRFDYEGATYALLEAQLAGFYEPTDGTMYMAADLDDENAFATLAHELVHALQDQSYDLAPHSKYVPREGDKSAAFSALAEGDATSAMADILIGQAKPGASALDMPDELFVEQVIGGMSGGAAANAPHVMRMGLVAPYIDGTLFVHALRRRGGWAAVDRAWENPPTTTEQILHVDKWDKHEPAIPIEVPRFSSLGPGWSDAESDTFGELGLRLALGEWLGASRAGNLAAGWGGDNGVLLKKGDEYAFAWRVRFDEGPPASPDLRATSLYGELAPAIEKLGHAPVNRARGPVVCIERADTGPLVVGRHGRDVVVLAGPAQLPSKAGGGAWRSAGHCPSSRKWALELLTP